ncbi:MAG: type II secretion system protein [Candidatus Saccharimonadales bacterium]
MLEKAKNSRGFTLIEVVIVLAIGALIILVVLNAISSAQRNQRDSTRRQEASQIAAALESYSANNGGEYPANTAVIDEIDDYLPELEGDVGGFKYTRIGAFDADACSTEDGDTYQITYSRSDGGRSYDLGVCLEVGGEVDIRNQ